MERGTHRELEPIAFLLGTWRGHGMGEYPTIDPFRYGEEMMFEQVGEPYLLYSQRGWLLDDGSPLHFERGFLRPAGEGRVEFVLAHPLGLVEVSEGMIAGTTIDVASTTVGRTATGDRVTEVTRRMSVAHGILSYELHMALEKVPLTRHLRARLQQVKAEDSGKVGAPT